MNKIILGLALILGTVTTKIQAQPAGQSVKFNKSLQSYYNLKNALATDKSADAQAAAQALQVAVKEVTTTGFQKVQQQQLWTKESAIILTQAALLEKTTELKEQRKAFQEISVSFISITKELKLNEQTAFVQYCPMGKYTWLNEVIAVQNPYYGSMMYDCGEVTGTLVKK